MLDKDNKAAQKFKALHKSVMDKFLQFETSLKPIHDKWEKPELGEGYSVVIDGGEFFDKAGINFPKYQENHYQDLQLAQRTSKRHHILQLEYQWFSTLKTLTSQLHTLM